MDEVEVEVHEVPDSIGEEKVLKEEGMVNEEGGTSNVEREETGVEENREETEQDQMEM